MLSDVDRSWLKELHLELWPPSPPDLRTVDQKRRDEALARIFPNRVKRPEPPKGRERLTNTEVIRLFQVIKCGKLIVSPFSYGFFGGIGIHIYDHEQYIGTGAESITTITDNHLPDPGPKSWHKKVLGKVYKSTGKVPGGIRDDAFDLFMKFSKTTDNLVWLSKYKLELPRDRVSYEY